MERRIIRVAVASQIYRTVGGQVETCRHFIVFELDDGAEPHKDERLNLPKRFSIREFSGDGPHPLDAVCAVIVSGAASASPDFLR